MKIFSCSLFDERCNPFSKPIYKFLLLYRAFLLTSEFFSPTNAPFIKHIKCLNVQLKYSYACSYMFRSTWTILRELMLSLAKATIFIVEMISENTSLYNLWCCGNKYFGLWCVYSVYRWTEKCRSKHRNILTVHFNILYV